MKQLQESGCTHSQAVQPSYFEVSAEAQALFLQYQAASAGIALNHDTVLLCNSTNSDRLSIGVKAKIIVSPNQHDNFHSRKQAISLCGHGVNGKQCPAYVGRPKPHHDHLSHPDERH